MARTDNGTIGGLGAWTGLFGSLVLVGVAACGPGASEPLAIDRDATAEEGQQAMQPALRAAYIAARQRNASRAYHLEVAEGGGARGRNPVFGLDIEVVGGALLAPCQFVPQASLRTKGQQRPFDVVRSNWQAGLAETQRPAIAEQTRFGEQSAGPPERGVVDAELLPHEPGLILLE